jgi:hypothetical protein
LAESESELNVAGAVGTRVVGAASVSAGATGAVGNGVVGAEAVRPESEPSVGAGAASK